MAAALAPRAKALRNGKIENIESINLVPGDVIIIRLGDIVPADVKILEEDGGMIGEETPMQVSRGLALLGQPIDWDHSPISRCGYNRAHFSINGCGFNCARTEWILGLRFSCLKS